MSRFGRVVRLAAALAILVAGGCGVNHPQVPLTILHVNDLHAHFLPDDQDLGGFARLATLIKQERGKSENSLALVAGDLVQGTPVSTIFEGMPIFEVANRMGFDAAVIGNHEFDYGWQKILEFERTANFPLVCANVRNVDDGSPLLQKPYVIKNVGGLRVGIIGVLTETLPSLTKSEQRGPWQVEPVVGALRKTAREIAGQTDLVIAVGHLTGEEEDQILEQVPEVAVLVSGHIHTGLEKAKVVDGRIGVRVKAYDVELGRLDLMVDPASHSVDSYQWRKIPVDGSITPDAEVARLVDSYESKVSELVDVEIGVSARRLTQSDLRPLIEQAMLDSTGADLAFENSGGIRDVVPKGKILARNIWNVLPFDNTLVSGKFLGRDLPEEVRSRGSIDPNREYVLVTNDFQADQWKSLGLKFPNEGPTIREAMIDWVRERKHLP